MGNTKQTLLDTGKTNKDNLKNDYSNEIMNILQVINKVKERKVEQQTDVGKE